MSKNNNNRLVPKLRFPEFKNDGDWVVKKIGEIFNSFSGGTPTTTKKGYYGGTIPFIRSAEIGKEETELFLTGDGLKNSSAKIVRKGDLLVALYGANSGESAISKIDGAINQAILCLQSEYSNTFAYNFLTLKKNWIVSKYIQGGQGNLSGDIVKSISIPFTNREEQQKIASCLSSLDEVITAESQKLEVLKEHKKGLLQNLFSQEGETVPKLRFKEFEGSGKWVEKKLDEIAEFLKGKGISKADVADKGKQPCIRYGELYTHYGEVIREMKSFTNLSEDDLILSEANDVIIPSSGETKEDIATASCVKLKGVALGGDLNILRSTLNGEFLAYYLSHGLKKAISKIAQGDTVVHLYSTQLKKLSIRVPSEMKEQDKIAETLSSIDAIINTQNQKLEALQLHKKGLLQGLFPQIIE